MFVVLFIDIVNIISGIKSTISSVQCSLVLNIIQIKMRLQLISMSMRDTSKMWFCSQVTGMAHISINDGAKAMCHLLTHFVLLFEEYSVSTFSTVQSLVLVGFETDAGHCVHVNLARPTNAGSDLILGTLWSNEGRWCRSFTVKLMIPLQYPRAHSFVWKKSLPCLCCWIDFAQTGWIFLLHTSW